MGVSSTAMTLPTAPKRTVLEPRAGLLAHEADGLVGAA